MGILPNLKKTFFYYTGRPSAFSSYVPYMGLNYHM